MEDTGFKSTREGDTGDELGSAELGSGGGIVDTGRVEGRAERGRGGDIVF